MTALNGSMPQTQFQLHLALEQPEPSRPGRGAELPRTLRNAAGELSNRELLQA
jgi:hypothetical protein